MRTALALITLLAPSVAHAEVLDKAVLPWEPRELALVVGITVGCVVTARLGRFGRGVAVVVAIAWAALRITGDDWYSADVGPFLQAELAELAPATAELYEPLLMMIASAPLVATLFAIRAWRTKRRPATASLGHR
ncbi:MAG: hypothetical protein H0T42_12440 [Deltaproteobacteria bacterium]|nr:hypothetical protein [Deltaproteobacteria bacterium]